MSFNYNHTTLVGRLTKDPDLNSVGSTSRSTFTLAIDRPYRKENGNPETDFINIIFWGKLAEISKQFLKKGRPALIEGRIQVRNYEKDNQRIWTTEVIGENFQVLEYSRTEDK